LRIILDTNVVLFALLWRGTPYCLLQTIRQREDIKRVSSNLLLEELADVLTRPGAAKRLALFNATAGQILADYAEAAHFVTPGAITRVIADDPDDDHVIAAAITAGANAIVSGDRHLLSLRTYRDIPILSPSDTLALITGAPS